jgi:cytochrome d ubiquinol oxidase subunit II
MSPSPGVIGLPELAALAIMLALNAYILTGGADFGGGIWDLLARGRRCAEQRALIAHAIGPIWEANHVWLILVIVLLFTAFPPVFAALGIVLHVPLSLMLLGIVLRGSSFVFRAYGPTHASAQSRWGRLFAMASILTPVMLGLCVGAIASGAAGRAAARISAAPARVGADFVILFVHPWLAPFPVAVGAMTLAMFSFLAAVYLAAVAEDDPLRDDFRRRAIAANVVLFATAGAALWIAGDAAPELRRALTTGPAVGLQSAIALSAVAALAALGQRRWSLARIAAGGQVSLILWGWALAQAPWLLPPMHTVRSAAAPPATLLLLLWILAAGGVLLLPSLAYLYRTFAPDHQSRAQ